MLTVAKGIGGKDLSSPGQGRNSRLPTSEGLLSKPHTSLWFKQLVTQHLVIYSKKQSYLIH